MTESRVNRERAHARRRGGPARGRLAEQLADGQAAAGEAGHRPDRSRHPPRARASCSNKLAQFQEAGPHGGADHRRLHGAGRRPQRPRQPRGPCSSAERDRRQRRRPSRSRRSRCSTATGPRSASTASGSTCRPRSCSAGRQGDGRAAARARRLQQADGGGAADLGARAPLSDHPGLRLGGDRVRRRARGDRPEVQPAVRPRHPARLRRAGAVGHDDADPARARRRAADEQVAGQLRRASPSRPRRCSGR